MQHDKPKVIIDFDEYIELRQKAGLATNSIPYISANDLMKSIRELNSDRSFKEEASEIFSRHPPANRDVLINVYAEAAFSIRDRILELIEDKIKK
jgi:hypothetical protein